jgi:hypothetical protein
MGRKLSHAREKCEAQVIDLGRSFRRMHAEQHSIPAGRTIRPIDVVLLLPLILPLVVAILLGLLGWFVAWLATVAAMVASLMCGDFMRGLRRRNDRALDRQAVG